MAVDRALNKKTLVAVSALACLLVSCAQMPEPAAVRRDIKVGFVHREADKYELEWRTYFGLGRHLEEEMPDTVWGLAESAHFLRLETTEEALYDSIKRFHVLLWGEELGSHAAIAGVRRLDDIKPGRMAMLRRVLERYVAEGGGLLLVPSGSRYSADQSAEIFNEIFANFGVQDLKEDVVDTSRIFMPGEGAIFPKQKYFYADAIVPHPVTEGVKRLYLPAFRRADGRNKRGSGAFQYSKDWTVVVRGSKKAQSYRNGPGHEILMDQPGTYRESPPIAALRSFGKGRVFVLASNEQHTYVNYKNPRWDGISESVGDAAGGHPSDVMKLTRNVVRWLAQPALDNADLGGYRPADYSPVKFAPAINWDAVCFLDPVEGVKGVIGLHSSYSDGEGTVQEYAAAARAAGLSFIVFTEDLKATNPGNIEKLKADCKEVSDHTFYACPGVEFIDGMGNGWAMWADRIRFPPSVFKGTGKRKDHAYPYWDGKRLHPTGAYSFAHNLPPFGMLGTRNLYAEGGHQNNMWWFHRFMPFVYEDDVLVEEDIDGWLYALRDLRYVSPASFTRIRRPADIAQAAATCATVLRGLPEARAWCNSYGRGQDYNPNGKSYVTQGPAIRLWDVINPQMEHYWKATRGAQRVRCKFEVSSDDGIAEVRVHDANYGIVRRYDGGGAKTLAREFEMPHDKQHVLCLEVIDSKGRKAISHREFIYCYKAGLYRCGDNLNYLNTATIITHPDRHQRLQFARRFEILGKYMIRGVDDALGGIATQGIHDYYNINAVSGSLPKALGEGFLVGAKTDVPFASYDVISMAMDRNTLIPRWGTEQRPTVNRGGIIPHVRERPWLRQQETMFNLRSRANYFIVHNHRRYYEGTRDYRGGLVWFEGKYTVKQDLELKAGVSIPILGLGSFGGAAKDQFDHLFVADADKGLRHWEVEKEGAAPSGVAGTVTGGGYVGAMPGIMGYYAILPGNGCELRYDGSNWANSRGKRGRVRIGIGQAKNWKVKAGDVLPYRFLVATVTDNSVSAGAMSELAETYNLDGSRDGYPFKVQVGDYESGEFFFTVRAANNEVLCELGPKPMICDLALRVKGIEDNGSAAIFVKKGREGEGFFRPVAVHDGTAIFQERIDEGVAFWAGNMLVARNKALRITPVLYGIDESRPPFVEVHNPTEQEISTEISTPDNMPVYGGERWRNVVVPSGSSIFLQMENGEPALTRADHAVRFSCRHCGRQGFGQTTGAPACCGVRMMVVE